ncbi:MAG: SpoIID/LytB domain-containing protein [Caldilineaceae bacterium]
MNAQRIIFKITLLMTMTFLLIENVDIPLANGQTSFIPPTEITIEMFQLDVNGNRIVSCSSNNANLYGCTSFCTDICGYAEPIPGRNYPFGSSTITVNIEGTEANNRYLRDVVAQEMSPSVFPQTALNSQAIAARTYAYWHIRTEVETPGAIDNSSAYQVFLPYRYDQFSNDEQTTIDIALQSRYYMAYWEPYLINIYGQDINLSESDPIFAEFTADVRELTHANTTFPYLTSVEDPISSHPSVPDVYGHGRGLSQRGAGRWARGSESFRCDPHPAACPPPVIEPPPAAWSVRWRESFQILTHYYTGIHIRDAGQNNTVKTPEYRWVPLKIEWSGTGQSYICEGESTTVTTVIQNTGTQPWDLNVFRFDYAIEDIPGGPQGSGQAVNGNFIIEPGEVYTQSLTIESIAIGPVGSVKLFVFDMYRGTQGSFRALEAGKPWYVFSEDIAVRDCKKLFLPTVLNRANISPSQ